MKVPTAYSPQPTTAGICLWHICIHRLPNLPTLPPSPPLPSLPIRSIDPDYLRCRIPRLSMPQVNPISAIWIDIFRLSVRNVSLSHAHKLGTLLHIPLTDILCILPIHSYLDIRFIYSSTRASASLYPPTTCTYLHVPIFNNSIASTPFPDLEHHGQSSSCFMTLPAACIRACMRPSMLPHLCLPACLSHAPPLSPLFTFPVFFSSSLLPTTLTSSPCPLVPYRMTCYC